MVCTICASCGEVTERLKVLAWKACVVQATEGSNPSLSAINFDNIQVNVLPLEVATGSRATGARELRQAWKGAAVTMSSVCRGGAWLPLVVAILFSG